MVQSSYVVHTTTHPFTWFTVEVWVANNDSDFTMQTMTEPCLLPVAACAVDNSGRSSMQELLEAVMLAERSSSSGPGEVPLGQWEVEALRGRADLLPPQLLMASPAQSGRKLSVEALAGMADVLVMSGEGRTAAGGLQEAAAGVHRGRGWGNQQVVAGACWHLLSAWWVG